MAPPKKKAKKAPAKKKKAPANKSKAEAKTEPKAKAKPTPTPKAKAKPKAKPKAKAKPAVSTSSLVKGVARTVGGVGIGLALGGIAQTAAERQGLPKKDSPGADRNVAAAARIKKNQAAAVVARNKLKENQRKADAAKPPVQTSSGRATESGKGIIEDTQKKQNAKPKRQGVLGAMWDAATGKTKKKKVANATNIPSAPIAQHTPPAKKKPKPTAKTKTPYTDDKNKPTTRKTSQKSTPSKKSSGGRSPTGAETKANPAWRDVKVPDRISSAKRPFATEAQYLDATRIAEENKAREKARTPYTDDKNKPETRRSTQVAVNEKVSTPEKPSVFSQGIDYILGRDAETVRMRELRAAGGGRKARDYEGSGAYQPKTRSKLIDIPKATTKATPETRKTEKPSDSARTTLTPAVIAKPKDNVKAKRVNGIAKKAVEREASVFSKYTIPRKPKGRLDPEGTGTDYQSKGKRGRIDQEGSKASQSLNNRTSIKPKIKGFGDTWSGDVPDLSDKGLSDKIGKSLSEMFGSYSAYSGVEGTSSWQERKYKKGKRIQ